MPELAVDFGLFIAYLIPGFLAFLGICFVFPPAEKILALATKGQDRLGGVFAIICFIVLSGMTASIWRAGTIDKSFEYAIPIFCSVSAPQACAVKKVEPVYAALLQKGSIDAYLLAEKNDKRPYQFYGNTLIAVLILFSGWIVRDRRRGNASKSTRLVAIIGLIVLVFTLYPAARLSHYRFMSSVAQFNFGEMPSNH